MVLFASVESDLLLLSLIALFAPVVIGKSNYFFCIGCFKVFISMFFKGNLVGFLTHRRMLKSWKVMSQKRFIIS